MNKEIKQKWVKDLLSGEYEQCFGTMSDGYGGYCCLGILALKTLTTRGYVDEYFPLSGLNREIARGLASVNDDGVPFEMIAGLIDQAL